MHDTKETVRYHTDEKCLQIASHQHRGYDYEFLLSPVEDRAAVIGEEFMRVPSVETTSRSDLRIHVEGETRFWRWHMVFVVVGHRAYIMNYTAEVLFT